MRREKTLFLPSSILHMVGFGVPDGSVGKTLDSRGRGSAFKTSAGHLAMGSNLTKPAISGVDHNAQSVKKIFIWLFVCSLAPSDITKQRSIKQLSSGIYEIVKWVLVWRYVLVIPTRLLDLGISSSSLGFSGSGQCRFL